MGTASVLLLILVVGTTTVHSALTDTIAQTSKKEPLSETKNVMPFRIQTLSKPEHGLKHGVNPNHVTDIRLDQGPSTGKDKPKVFSQTYVFRNDMKGITKPKQFGKRLFSRGRNLRKKIRNALKPMKRKMQKIKVNKNIKSVNKGLQKIKFKTNIKPIKSTRQMRFLKFRPKQMRKSKFGPNKITKAVQKKLSKMTSNWRKGQKFSSKRFNTNKRTTGKKTKIIRKRPRNMRYRLLGLKRKGRLLNAIKSAIGSIQRKTKKKKKSKLSTGYLRRLVGIPSKRFKSVTNLEKLKLKDVLQKAGIRLPKNKNRNTLKKITDKKTKKVSAGIEKELSKKRDKNTKKVPTRNGKALYKTIKPNRDS